MDTATIAKRGIDPLGAAFDQIGAVQDRRSLATPVAALNRVGIAALFRTPQITIPEYYVPPRILISPAFRDYAQRLFRLAGDDRVAAEREATAAVAVARALRELPHEPEIPLDGFELTRLAPAFDWTRYFAGLGQAEAPGPWLADPSNLEAVNGLVMTTPLSAWRSYLRWRWLDGTATLLPAPFVKANFAFYVTAIRAVTRMPSRQRRCRGAVAMFNDHDYAGVRVTRHDYFGDTLRLRAERVRHRLP